MEYVITLTLAGASGNVDSNVPIFGFVEAVQLVYSGQPGTTVATLAEKSGAARNVLAISAANTNAVWYPRINVNAVTGAAQAAIWDKMYLNGQYLNLAVSSGAAGSVIARVIVSPLPGAQ